MGLIRGMFLWVEFLRCSVACNTQNTVAIASIYSNILWFVFYLIHSMLFRVSSENLMFLSISTFYFETDQI